METSGEKKSTSFLIPQDVLENIRKMTKRWNFVRMSRLVTYVFRHFVEDPVITMSLIRNIDIKTPLEGAVIIAEEEAKRIMNKKENMILDMELVVCPLRREHHIRHSHIVLQEFLNPTYLTTLILRLGLRAVATVNPLCFYSYPVRKEIKIDDKIWILDVLIDIKSPDGVWYISRSGAMDLKSSLMAWIYKCVTNAKHAYVITFSGSQIVEIEVTPEHLKKFSEEFEVPLKDSDSFLRALAFINVKKKKVPFWPNECDICPYRIICRRRK